MSVDPTGVQRAFAVRMRSARAERGLSQDTLARALRETYGLNFTDSKVTRMERWASGRPDAQGISLDEAVAIASLLRLSLDDLIDRAFALPQADGSRLYRITYVATPDVHGVLLHIPGTEVRVEALDSDEQAAEGGDPR